MNKVIIVGNITRDIELRQAGDSHVADLGVAVNKRYKNKSGETVENTVFVDVTVWGAQAENSAKYLNKGSKVLVEGELKMETWVDKESGKNRSKLGVNGLSVQFLDSKGGGENSGAPQKESSNSGSSGGGDFANDDDIPF